MARQRFSFIILGWWFIHFAVAQVHDPRAIEADPRTATGPIAPVLEGLGD